jgi:hypothetical protein
MSLRDCKCGRPVRLGGHKVRFNGRQGVFHYIAHTNGESPVGKEWSCVAFKPYPKDDADKPYRQMVNRWEAEATREECGRAA